MSVTYSSKVILGVRISDLGLKIEKISNRFEIHDIKGKPTGKFEDEISWKISFKGKEITEEGVNFYFEDFVEYSGILPEINSPLSISNCNHYDEEFDIDKVIIGVIIAERDYGKYNLLKEIEIEENIDLVKDEFEHQFGVDIEPKVFFYCNIS